MDCRWPSLGRDVLVKVAEALEAPDRHRLNLVCTTWNRVLKQCPQLWEVLALDPRHCKSRRLRPWCSPIAAHLPSWAALQAWIRGYGAHVRVLHLSHLDSAAQDAGCASPARLAEAVAPLLPRLESLSVDLCRDEYARAALRLLPRAPKLASLTLNLYYNQAPPRPGGWAEWEPVESGLPETLCELRLTWDIVDPCFIPSNPPPWSLAWVGRFTALRTLCIHSQNKFCAGLPPDLASWTALRDLELDGRLLAHDATGRWIQMSDRAFATSICGLTALTRLALSDTKLGERADLLEEWNEEDPDDDLLHLHLFFPLPEAITGLQALRSLTISDHAMTSYELALLAHLTGLTSLTLEAHMLYPQPPIELPGELALPSDLSALTGIRELSISHRLTEMPDFLSALALTKLSLALTSISTLPAAPYLARLAVLDLKWSQLSALPPAVHAAHATLRELNLYCCRDLKLTRSDADFLASCPELTRVKALHLCKDPATQEALAHLAATRPDVVVKYRPDVVVPHTIPRSDCAQQ